MDCCLPDKNIRTEEHSRGKLFNSGQPGSRENYKSQKGAGQEPDIVPKIMLPLSAQSHRNVCFTDLFGVSQANQGDDEN